jgi:FG-GAP-like repeat
VCTGQPAFFFQVLEPSSDLTSIIDRVNWIPSSECLRFRGVFRKWGVTFGSVGLIVKNRIPAMRTVQRVLLTAIVLLVGQFSCIAVAQTQFIDDRFEDFAAGTPDDGGNNLYVARDGTLRTINRFDLNGDGYLDLLFNCTHNTYQMLPATAGSIDRRRHAKSTDIAVEGSQRSVMHDLNRDGYTDVIFCPNSIGVHHERRFVTVAWGGAEGWTASRINSPLPMNAATAVAAVDLNLDDWPDIAILGAPRWRPQQPEGGIVRIFWGSSTGYSVTEFHDLGIPAAADLAAEDFDGDAARDLAVLRTDGRITLVWSAKEEETGWKPATTLLTLPAADSSCITAGDVTGDGRPDLVIGSTAAAITIVATKSDRQWAEPKRIVAFSSTQITVADFDRDHHTDFALTQFDQARAAGGEQAGAGKNAKDRVRLMWGSENGHSADRTTSLEIPLAVATGAGDLDNDGHVDLAIAIHQGDTTFAGESFAYFGDGRRHFTKGASGFRTSGTLHVAVAPAEQGLPARAVFSNSIGGQLDEAVPLHLFWGGAKGFDPDHVWKIPFHSGYEGSASDLNADGFPDLILLNSGHSGEHAHADPTLGANILWGGPEGLEKSAKRTILHEHFLGTSSVADLNRDGWLDLVLEPFGAEHAGEKEKLILYYGGADGFPQSRRVALTMTGYAQEHLVADFNRDQWLDIAVTTRSLDCVRILWGGPDGFDTNRDQRLKIAGPVGVDAADFNGDGWLDLLAGSYNDPVSGHRDMGLVLFWGSPDGFRHANAQWLPGFSPLGRTIADFDADGWLDIVSPQQSGELTREDLACHLYWGSAEGFATRRRTTFFCDSVNDTMAADFNSDGRIDLAVNCHTRHGDHRTQSRVFYNDGARFENPAIQKLPTNGPHLIWAADVGHICDRKYRQTFESRVLKWNANSSRGTLTSKAVIPAGARLEFDIRSAATKEMLMSAKWTGLAKDDFAVDGTHRFLQYRAKLLSDNGDRYPVVDRVEISLWP